MLPKITLEISKEDIPGYLTLRILSSPKNVIFSYGAENVHQLKVRLWELKNIKRKKKVGKKPKWLYKFKNLSDYYIILQSGKPFFSRLFNEHLLHIVPCIRHSKN